RTTGQGPGPICLTTYPNWGPTCAFLNTDSDLAKTFDGISHDHTGVKMKQITDGASKTILVAEKSVQPRFYNTGYGDPPASSSGSGWGADDGDNDAMYQGFDWDTHRFPSGSLDGNGQPQGHLPIQDTDCDGAALSPCKSAALGEIKYLFG